MSKDSFKVHYIFAYILFLGIVGHDVFTGCLYRVPDWASLAWIPNLIAESKAIRLAIISNGTSDLWLISHYNFLGILAILAIYKCRKYGEFTPTFVRPSKVQEL